MSNIITDQPASDASKPNYMLSTIDLSDDKTDTPSNCPKVAIVIFQILQNSYANLILPNFSAHIAKFILKINCVDIRNMLSYDPINCNCSCVCCDIFQKRADLFCRHIKVIPVTKDSSSQTSPTSSNSDEELEYGVIQPGSSAIAL